MARGLQPQGRRRFRSRPLLLLHHPFATRESYFLGKRRPGGHRYQLVRPGVSHQPPGPQPGRVGLVLPAALRRHPVLILYVMRLQDGSLDAASSGTLVDPQGQARHLTLADFTIRAAGTGNPPTPGPPTRQVGSETFPGRGTPHVQPTLADQELRTGMNSSITYSEGQLTVQGTGKKGTVTGQGYVEPATPAPWAAGSDGVISGRGLRGRGPLPPPQPPPRSLEF